jgi:Fur family iron response transcriptional regulator
MGFMGKPMAGLDEAAIEQLRRAGLRPTRQRRELAFLLFGMLGEAITAEGLHGLAVKGGIKVSLATVYGTLHCFHDAGLVREISIDSKHYFDCNTTNHHYFYFEEERRLVGVSEGPAYFKDIPLPPKGCRVSRVDVVVRLCKDETSGQS